MRRQSDLLIREIIRYNRTMLDLLHGKAGDFGRVLCGIQQLSTNLGRREDDRKAGCNLADGFQGIANLLLRTGVIEQLPRRVRLKKLKGKMEGSLPVGVEKEGWEKELPKAGERYCLYMDNGFVCKTSPIKDCGADHIRTRNSVYTIEVLDDADKGNRTQKEEVYQN